MSLSNIRNTILQLVLELMKKGKAHMKRYRRISYIGEKTITEYRLGVKTEKISDKVIHESYFAITDELLENATLEELSALLNYLKKRFLGQ